jgi:predicted amidohydrolase YtcJ
MASETDPDHADSFATPIVIDRIVHGADALCPGDWAIAHRRFGVKRTHRTAEGRLAVPRVRNTTTTRACLWLSGMLVSLGLCGGVKAAAEDADLILHHGKIVTADRDFSIRQALAVNEGRLIRLGTNDDVLQTRGPSTAVIDLQGKTVLPGLIDSHTHPTDASMIEFDHPVPEMKTIADVLDYIHSRAEALGSGRWVVVRQVFITRLLEQRYPTRAELDRAAPSNPVLFATGPDASVNSLALKLSGIDKNFRVDGPGKIETDPRTGEPTGILRNCTRYIKQESPDRKPTEADQDRRLIELLKDYNSVGITSIIDRDADPSAIDRYQRLHDSDILPVRVGISHHVETTGPLEKIFGEIRKVADHPLHRGGPRLRIVGIKTYLDGGMLTGSAYMRAPWGVSKIYAIDDPSYRGVLFIPPERLKPIVQATVQAGLQFTAHSVGDGAVHALLDAYEAVNTTTPIASTRPCITHSNFMSREAIAQAARLGVMVDIQPAWLYLDTRTLATHFGYDRLRYFQPLHSLFEAGVIAGGGSDHMQKIGSLRSINPYNPFLAMWVAITRRASGFEGQLHPEEALTRAEAIRFYTINNARLLFLEERTGSLEQGKQADFVVIDRDLLTCPEDDIKDTRALATYLDGKPVFQQNN